MLSINPKEISTQKLHGYLSGAIAPRPIAFASTIDADGNPNLSPFSFFNVFGANPPILIFSPLYVHCVLVFNNLVVLRSKENLQVIIFFKSRGKLNIDTLT